MAVLYQECVITITVNLITCAVMSGVVRTTMQAHADARGILLDYACVHPGVYA